MVNKSNTKYVERELFAKVEKWLEEPEIIAINGARQTGKTTLLLHLKDYLEKEGNKVEYFNLEETRILESFIANPINFINLHLSPAAKNYFCLDEFQHIENGGKILKLLYDTFPKVKFIITGSSSLSIREIASYLVGRVIYFSLYPFSFGEYLLAKEKTGQSKIYRLWKKFKDLFISYLQTGFLDFLPELIYRDEFQKQFEEYMYFGGYPAIVSSPTEEKKQKRIDNLIDTYIEKDIIKFLRIGNFLLFKKFTRMLSSQIGNLINYSSYGSEIGLNFRQTRQFLDNLETTFVVKRLPPYFTNRVTEAKKSPKIFFVDLGLRNGLIEDFRNYQLRQDKGSVVENVVFGQLSYRDETRNLSFWRTKQGAEVDFVLRYENEIIPVEVKYQDFAKDKLSRSFISFLNIYKPKKAIVLTKNYTSLLKYQNIYILFLPAYCL